MKNLVISLVLVFSCVFGASAQIDDPNVMSGSNKITDKFGDKIPNSWIYKVACNAKFSNSVTASSNAVIIFHYSSLEFVYFELHEYSTLNRFTEDPQDKNYSVSISVQNGETYHFPVGAVFTKGEGVYDDFVSFVRMIDDLSKLKQGTKIAIEMVERGGYGTPTEARAVVKYDKDFVSFVSKVKAKLVNNELYKEYKNQPQYQLTAEEERVIREFCKMVDIDVSKIYDCTNHSAKVLDNGGRVWNVYFCSSIDGVVVTSVQ